jgi:hypothetical protein
MLINSELNKHWRDREKREKKREKKKKKRKEKKNPQFKCNKVSVLIVLGYSFSISPGVGVLSSSSDVVSPKEKREKKKK